MPQKSKHPSAGPVHAITKTEFLTDRVRVHYSCPRPWGTDDERVVVEVPYSVMPILPGLPSDHGHGEFREAWEESVYIPAVKMTLLFRFAKWQETDDCRMESLVGGPYLATTASPSRVAAD